MGFPSGSVVKNPLAMQEMGVGSLGQDDPLEGNGNSLQYSCLEIPMDRGTWWTTVHGVARVRHDWACRHTMVVLFWVFLEQSPPCCPQRLHEWHSHRQRTRSPFSPQPHHWHLWFFWQPSDGYEVWISPSFGFASDAWWCWASSHVPVGYLHSLFGKMSIQFFCPFFFIELYEMFIYFGY